MGAPNASREAHCLLSGISPLLYPSARSNAPPPDLQDPARAPSEASPPVTPVATPDKDVEIGVDPSPSQEQLPKKRGRYGLCPVCLPPYHGLTRSPSPSAGIIFATGFVGRHAGTSNTQQGSFPSRQCEQKIRCTIHATELHSKIFEFCCNRFESFRTVF